MAAGEGLESSCVCFVADGADFTVCSAFRGSRRTTVSQNMFGKDISVWVPKEELFTTLTLNKHLSLQISFASIPNQL